MSINATLAWAQLHKHITDFVGPDDQNGLIVQPLSIAQAVEWDTKSHELNLYYQYKLANTIPSWNPLYTGTSTFVEDGYRSLIDRLTTDVVGAAQGIDKNELNEHQKGLREAQYELQLLEERSRKGSLAYRVSTPENERVNRGQWEQDNGISGEREMANKRMAYHLGGMTTIINNAGPAYQEIGRAVNALGDTRNRINLPTDPNEIEAPELWNSYPRAGIIGDISRFNSEVRSFSRNINHTEQHSSTFHSRWSVAARASWFGVFNARGGYEHTEISRHWESTTTDINLSFQNIQAFPIRRTQWFNGGIIDTFRDKMPKTFWGDAGKLPLIPVEVVLARGLSISVVCSQTQTDYTFDKVQAGGGGGFCIGPFSFGASSSYTREYSKLDIIKNSNGFTIVDKSGRGVVLAVKSQRPLDLYSGTDLQSTLYPSRDVLNKKSTPHMELMTARLLLDT